MITSKGFTQLKVTQEQVPTITQPNGYLPKANRGTSTTPNLQQLTIRVINYSQSVLY